MIHTLGIDFGTSNTAAAVMAGDRPFLIPVEPGETTLPTSVFFDTNRRQTVYGTAANKALIDGREGRFMRALKSVLGTPLMRERRQIAYEKITLLEVVARFLSTIKTRAEDATGLTFDTVLSGRPVRFHPDPARDKQAEADLRTAYVLAGFKDVSFMFEPEAAAQTSRASGLGMIIDIGGGTSDFSIFEQGTTTRIIASHGVRVGGTDFDRALSLASAMPLLGRGQLLKNEMGPGTYTAPNQLFNDLATWEKIAFLYTPETLRLTERYAKLGVDPTPFQRLNDVIDMEMGHDIAFAIEAAKIKANKGDTAIDLSFINADLRPDLSNAAMQATLAELTEKVSAATHETLAQAELPASAIGTIVYVGGSSLMGTITDAMGAIFPTALQEQTNAFTAVADGLALAASKGQA